MREMFDACSWIRPPSTARMVAGYVSGGCEWPPAGWQAWAHVTRVQIATGANVNRGQVLDVERGDATPDQAPGWCARARQRGQLPTVYTSASNVAAVLDACKVHDVPPPLLWVALWDGIAELPPGAIAKQHTNDNAHGYDVSCVADYWPGVDPAPQPVEDDVAVILAIREGTSPDPNGAGAVYLVNNWPYGPKRHVTAAGDLPGYIAVVGEPKVVDAFLLDRMIEEPPIATGITEDPT